MTLTSISSGSGRVQASETDLWIRPSRGFQFGSRRGVLYAHQGTASGLAPIDYTNFAGTARLLDAIAGYGYVVASQDLGGTAHWGNTTAQARVGATDSWLLASTAAGASTADRIAVGISMGGAAAVNYFGKSPGHVADLAALVLILPALNLDFYYQNDTGSARAPIETAWGITYPTALPANADPQTNMALIAAATIPTRIYFASDDPIQDSAMATANLAALGGNGSTVNLGALGHTDAAIAAIDKPDLIAWLQSVAPA